MSEKQQTPPATRNQLWAQRAIACVQTRKARRDTNDPGKTPRAPSKEEREYRAFAKRFPSLIHTCGLAQALAFAVARKHSEIADDLAVVLGEPGCGNGEQLAAHCRGLTDVNAFLRLSRSALAAAGWIKRYAEGLLQGDEA